MKNSDSLFYLRFPREDCEALLAEGMQDSYEVAAGEIIDWMGLKEWMANRGDWIFGWIGYDARRSLEHFEQENLESSRFPQLHLFIPKNIFKISGEKVEVVKGEWKPEYEHWLSLQHAETNESIELEPRISFEEYKAQFNLLQQQIALGNIYEINYCVPFQAKAHLIDVPGIWKRLYHHTEAPFSAFAQCSGHHVLCASPERYLRREGNRVVSQPIKGTVRRSQVYAEDDRLRMQLRLSKKERSENVMIVDLVRNDLARCAKRSSVKVDELFGVYTFKTVHHLISTVSCEVDSSVSWVDLVQASFPMGSMTGAPKVSAMQLIGRHELTERGIYSGSIGYIEPSGDFDFNVVIRSVQYDDDAGLVSCHVGGALTAQSNPEDEYQECLLKSKAVLSALLR